MTEPATLTDQRQVFISYSRADLKYAKSLASWLDGHGVRCWFDQSIARGSKWETDIFANLDVAAAVLLLMSKAARRSPWVDREIERAEMKAIPVYPLLVEMNGMLPRAAHLQLDNVIDGRMPSLNICQKLPGFLVSERDVAAAISDEQRKIATRIFAQVGMVGSHTKNSLAIAALQLELMRVGLDPGPLNGKFGAKTRRAVIEFQARRCQEPLADGIAGPRTWAILINSSFGDLAPTLPAS